MKYCFHIAAICRTLFTHFPSARIKVRLEVYKGNLINAGVWSPYSLYREDIATFAAGGDYKQSDATGFISIYGLPTKVQAVVNSEKEGE